MTSHPDYRRTTRPTHLGFVFVGLFAVLCLLEVGQGAEPGRPSDKHWSYVPPTRPTPPNVPNTAWLRQPLDAFIADRHRQAGVAPSPEADRTTLIRRITFDLTGLPPTPDEVAAFLADGSPDAYERLVDRLLASPRYGERMAVDWLDLARYADTHGYHSDSERQMWRWRDWVIDALNAGMPYDQFTVEQIAGDLLPDATLEQRLATGFHRNHMLNDENGAIPEEYLAEYVAERASTTATVWLGQTLSCARCHDHKHDPFTQREFFEFYAFFNNVPENGLGGRNGNAPPVLMVPTRQQQQELEALTVSIESLDRRLAARAASEASRRDQQTWEAEQTGTAGALNAPPSDAAVHLKFDESSGDTAANAADVNLSAKLRGKPAWLEGKFGQALLCDGETFGEMQFPLSSDKAEPFTLSAWVFPTTGDTLPIVSRFDETQYRRGFEWRLDGYRPQLYLTHESGANELAVQGNAKLKPSRWQHVTVTYDGSGRASGVRMFVDAQPIETEVLSDTLTQHIATDQPLRIARGDEATFFRGMLDEVQAFERALSAEEVARLAGGDPIREIVALSPEKRSAAQQQELRKYFLEHVDSVYRQLLAERRSLERRRTEIERAAPSVMVLAEMETPRPTYVHLAGRYDLRGEQVEADVPAVLPPLNDKLPHNRLALALWLVDENNPLTARVAANRCWQTLLGDGIVRTPDDFGLLGQRPTHPELLDWLACELVEGDWDVKRLHRMIATSATYRQSSNASDELLESDPENRLFARSIRRRLSAEVLRDAALQAAGILQPEIGGRPVRPYQPADLWTELAYNPKEYSAQVFEQSHGADLYRRSLYTFWKRSAPAPNMSLLDAPNRETCTVARAVTESPLQALVLLNDTTFVEAARLLAERTLASAEPEPRQRIDFIFRKVLSRPATDEEAAALLSYWKRKQQRYTADPEAANKLLTVGDSKPNPAHPAADLAAWANVASIVLNLDEALMKN